MPVDRSDHRLAQVPDPHQRLKVELDEPVPVGLILWRTGRQFTRVEVKTRGKRLPARASDYHYADVFIGLNGIKCRAQLG